MFKVSKHDIGYDVIESESMYRSVYSLYTALLGYKNVSSLWAKSQ